MLLGSSKWVSTAFSATWKVKATPAGRSLFQLALSARRTSESGSSSWPTPTATDAKGANTRSEGKERPVCDDDLPTRVLRLFPTPCADDAQATVAETHRGTGTRKKLIWYARRPEERLWRTPNTLDSLTPKSQTALAHELEHRPGRAEPNNLRDQVAVVEGLRRWPTPTAKDADSAANATATRSPGSTAHPGTTLTDAIRLWPTPQAQETGWKEIEVVDRDGNPPEHFNQRLYNRETGQIVQKGLEQAVLWPTPMSYSFAGSHSPGLTKLDIAVRGLYPGKKYGVKGPVPQEAPEPEPEPCRNWPTPTSSMQTVGDLQQAMFAGNSKRRPSYGEANALWETPPCDCPGPAGSLAREVWPTPLSRDGKGGCQLGRMRNGRVCWDNLDQAIQAARPGGLLDPASPSTPGSRPEQLSAAWVEALQGFPAGHTALEPSEMPSSRRRSTPSSRRSRTAKPTD